MASASFIKGMISSGNSEQFSAMEFVEIDDIAKTVCAFLNGKGGHIAIGISAQLEIKGVNGAENVIGEIQSIGGKISPVAPISVWIEPVDGKDLIIVRVWQGPRMPYIYARGIFIRNGSSTVRASTRDLAALMENRRTTDGRWENQVVAGVGWNEIDENELKKTMASTPQGANADPQTFLEQFGLTMNGQLTNAAILLYGKNTSRFLPQSKIIISLPDAQEPKVASGEVIIQGNIFINYAESLDYILTHIELNTHKISDVLRSYDINLAIRSCVAEALLNAVLHCNYTDRSSHIRVDIFKKKVQIANPGTFENNITIDTIASETNTYLRNPSLFHVFCMTALWKNKGGGAHSVVENSLAIGAQAPFWSCENGSVAITFPGLGLVNLPGIHSNIDAVNTVVNIDNIEKIKTKNVANNDNVIDYAKVIVNNSIKKDLINVANATDKEPVVRKIWAKKAVRTLPDRAVQRSVNKLNSSVKKIFISTEIEGISNGVKNELARVVQYLKKNPGVMTADIADHLKKPKPTTERYLSTLKHIAMIEFRGAPKSGGYYLTLKALERVN